MQVSKLINARGGSVLTVHPDQTLAETARRFAEPTDGRRYSVAVVCTFDDQVVGVVSLGDIVYAMGQHEARAPEMRVREVMSSKVLTCGLDDNIEDALKTMADHAIRHMPVVVNGKLVGLLARRDALEFLYQQASLDVAHLTEWLFRSDARY